MIASPLASKPVTDTREPTTGQESRPAESPTKSSAKSRRTFDISTSSNMSPNYDLQEGNGEVEHEDEEELVILQNNGHNTASASSSTLAPLRPYNLTLRGPEDHAWLAAASRPAFSVNPAPASQLAQPLQHIVRSLSDLAAAHALSDLAHRPQHDPVTAPPRLVPESDTRPTPRSSSTRTRRPQQAPAAAPPPRQARSAGSGPHASSGHSGLRSQDAEPSIPPVQATPTEPPTLASPDNIWPSQEFLRGASEARQAFLEASSQQSSSGGHIFASLQQQSVIVASDSAWRRTMRESQAAAEAAQGLHRVDEHGNRFDKLGRKISTKRKRPGESVFRLEKSTKKARASNDRLQESKDVHDDDVGEHGRQGYEAQVDDASEEASTVHLEKDTQDIPPASLGSGKP